MFGRLFGRRTPAEKPAPVAAPVTPAEDVHCDVAPADYLTTTVLAANDQRPARVIVRLSQSGDEGSVALSPAKARQLAAGLLNQADGLDGFRPLFDKGAR